MNALFWWQWQQQHQTNENHAEQKNQYRNFYKYTITLALKTEATILCPLHGCHWCMRHDLSHAFTSMMEKTSNSNQPQWEKINAEPSTRKQQHQSSRQSCKCHALHMNTLNHLFLWQWQQQHQTINNHAQWHQRHQTTINLKKMLHIQQENDNIRAQDRDTNVMLFAWMSLISFDGNDKNNIKQSTIMFNQTTINLNLKNSTMHFPQANNNISPQDRAANVMLFAWMPSITSFNAKDDNGNTSWMCSHFWHILAYF